ncbi:MAG TPA: porin family protein [Vicinamibacterales bacterium]|jgi:hypothetical protein|nr:porin family protein [Vicinamibacterales bacterium]
MKNSLRLATLGAILLVGSAVSASAQELSVGYQWQHVSCCDSGDSYPLGFNLDLGFPINPSLSAIGQIDWSKKSDAGGVEGVSLDVTMFGGGVRWTGNGTAQPFIDVLLGVAHSGTSFNDLELSNNDFALQFGGGVAVPMNEKVSVVGQFDYRPIFSDETQNSIRLVGGIRIKL